jgi:hypothetical protein
MGLAFKPWKIEHSSLGKVDSEIIFGPESSSIEELMADDERLQMLIVELVLKNEYLRTRLQAEKSI